MIEDMHLIYKFKLVADWWNILAGQAVNVPTNIGT